MKPTRSEQPRAEFFGLHLGVVALSVLAAGGLGGVWSEGLLAGSSAPGTKYAAVGCSVAPGAPGVERAALEESVRDAAAAGARVVVLPEIGSAPEPIPGETTEGFGALARRLGIWIALGIRERGEAEEGGAFYRTAVLLDDHGTVRRRHRTVLVAPDEIGTSVLRGSPRELLDTVDVGERRVGVLTASDLRAGLPRLIDRGAESVLVVGDSGATGDDGFLLDLCEALSRRHSVHLVVGRTVSAAPSGAGAGRSWIFGPDGQAPSERRGGPHGVIDLAVFAPSETAVQEPTGLPSLPIPVTSPLTPEIVDLGRDLFFDQSLSHNGRVSCASCHRPERAFTDGRSTGVGLYGERTHRNVPSLLNVAYRPALFWDGFVGTLENQAKYPTSHAREMDRPYLDELLAHVRSRSDYRRRFARAMGADRVEFEHVARALASYQRTLLSGDSPFDRFRFGGEPNALDASAQRGLDLFTGRAGCSRCHTIGPDHALFSDARFHNTGVAYDDQTETFTDLGLAGLSDASKTGMFLTPSLRNVAETAPYMHDGSFATLTEVVRFYNRGGRENPYLDPVLEPLGLEPREIRDLVAFLRSLTGAQRYGPDGTPLDPERDAVIAAVRLKPVPGDWAANRDEIVDRVAEAAGRGAQIVVLPEHAELGPPAALALEPGVEPTALGRRESDSRTFFSQLAARNRVWLAVSMLEVDRSGASSQRMVLLNAEGRTLTEHAKVAVRPERGDAPAEAGQLKALRAAETPWGRFGILSGDDVLAGIPRLAEMGADVILVSASWASGEGVPWRERVASLASRYGVEVVVGDLVASDHRTTVAWLRGGGRREMEMVEVGAPPGESVAILATAAPMPEPVPLGLPPRPVPRHLQETAAAVKLGQELFFDPRLSGDGSVSCATCHRPEAAFTDGEPVAVGLEGREGQRNTPSLLNTVYRPVLLWDGREMTLEGQVRRALVAWDEMDSDLDAVVRYVNERAPYGDDLRQLVGRERIRFEDVARVIAAFERTLVAGDSPFDRWYYAGDESAISAGAKAGFRLFAGKAGCVECHRVGEQATLFTDQEFHNTGVGYHPRFEYLGYGGDGLESNVATENRFRGEYLTPSLRNVALTAPYMHDGSIGTLEEVIAFYRRGGIRNPHLDSAMRPLPWLTAEEVAHLVEFLRSLTSDDIPEPRPPAVDGARLAGFRRTDR